MAILTLLDYLLLTGLIAGIWVSFNRGFVVEGIDLVKWVVAIYVVTEYWPVLQEVMAPYIDNPDIRLLAGVAALIVGTVIAGEAAKYLFDQFVKWPQVRLADKILGGMFGFAKWSIIGVIILVVMALGPVADQIWWKESRMVERLAPVGNMIIDRFPQDLQKRFNW
ncbi:MAG: CvpA family protein [Gammaproteobacteria bacterium]|nr:CvpA family protein [Gammaproteobacteria bacterium]